VGEQFRRALALVQPGLDVRDVLLEGAYALARDVLADQIADEQAEQGMALERGERDRVAAYSRSASSPLSVSV
jgi:hypothetical protein